MAAKIIVLTLYALVIILVGIRGLKKTTSFNDFFLGGGKVGAWMSAFSYGTAYFSAVLFIGFAGKIGWQFGYSGIWIGIMNGLIGVLLVWALIGWKTKKMTLEYGVYTMSEFLEKRYNSSSFKLLASIVIFVFMIPYSAAVFMGLSYLFTATFHMQFWVALLFMGIFTAVYLVLGGYNSGALMDMIFGIIMTIGVITLLIVILIKGEGLQNITSHLSSIDPRMVNPISPPNPPGFITLISLVILTSLAPLSMPQLVQKFYAIKDKKAVKIGMIASTGFALLVGVIVYFVGSTGRFFINPQNTPQAFFANGQPNFDRIMPELLANTIPDSLSSVILLLLLSASMSTLAAIVLISSSSVVKDFYAGFINKQASDKKLTLLMRISSAVFIALSVVLASFKIDTIVSILGISWGAIGSFFIGPFIWGLYWKRVNRLGGFASGILGLTVCITLYIVWGKSYSPQAGTIGMLTSLVANPIFSLFCKTNKTV
jgi:solute:Na+ symporter, SSS family